MKTIGLIGGVSCESSALYYQLITRKSNRILGQHISAKIIMVSVNTQQIVEAIHNDRWSEAGEILADAAQKLERAGADFIVLCSNTMHKIADQIKLVITLPFLDILMPTARKIKEMGFMKVALLGTKFTMEDNFFKQPLLDDYNIHSLLPETHDKNFIHEAIFNELCYGIINIETKLRFQKIILSLINKGAEAIVLGCTEIPLLIREADVNIPILDILALHVDAIISFALADDEIPI